MDLIRRTVAVMQSLTAGVLSRTVGIVVEA
jgi:hypothetical protein